MADPIKVHCELCGTECEIVQNVRVNPDGTSVEWPKAVVRADGLYFAINCPNCGEHEQCMAKKGDTE